jgi:hypothetical protein
LEAIVSFPDLLGWVAVVAGAGTRVCTRPGDDGYDAGTQTGGSRECYTAVLIQIVGAANGFFLKYFQGQAFAGLLIFHKREFNGICK